MTAMPRALALVLTLALVSSVRGDLELFAGYLIQGPGPQIQVDGAPTDDDGSQITALLGLGPPPGSMRLELLDGSVIIGQVSTPELSIKTEFGDLKVPMESVTALTPGLDSHPDMDRRLGELIQQAGQTKDDDPAIGAAREKLLALGAAIIPELRRHCELADDQGKQPLNVLLETLVNQEDQDDRLPMFQREDTVITSKFKVVGKLSPGELKITSRVGPVTVKLSDVRTARRLGVAADPVNRTIAVEGANILGINFKKTGLRLHKGDQISLTASGSVNLTPWDALSTPDGAAQCGWALPGIANGTLVARIGSGAVFKVGSKCSFTADQGGLLQLAVAMTPDYAGQSFPGQYQVKITHQARE
ncbi:MAG: hypothetical protein WD042_07850 [Phycisphaeraceae bacterium]